MLGLLERRVEIDKSHEYVKAQLAKGRVYSTYGDHDSDSFTIIYNEKILTQKGSRIAAGLIGGIIGLATYLF